MPPPASPGGGGRLSLPAMEQPDRTALVGGFYATAAFLFWGLSPIYFKLVGHVPADQVLAHRAVWSAILLALLLTALRRWPDVHVLV